MERNQTDCPAGHKAVSIRNGVICYTGTLVGSLAYASCKEGYHFNSLQLNDSAVIKCQENGKWNEEYIPFQQGNSFSLVLTPNQLLISFIADINIKKSQKNRCSTSLGILGAVFFLVLLGTGAAFTALSVYIKFYYKTRPKPEVPIYEYVSHSVGGIETESNLSYIQRVLGLPMPRKTPAESVPTENK